MKALLIIAMQKGSFSVKTPKFDQEGVVKRINALTKKFRNENLPVIVIQHEGNGIGEFEKGSVSWENLDALDTDISDIFIDKFANDVFYRSRLQYELNELEIDELFIAGCATDLCVESTVQSALVKDYKITIVSDAHTTTDRSDLTAEQLISHYNWVWQNMLPTKGSIQVKCFKKINEEMNTALNFISSGGDPSI